jgi:hypothetical protein
MPAIIRRVASLFSQLILLLPGFTLMKILQGLGETRPTLP